MKKVILLIIFLSISMIICSQDTTLSKRNLKQIFSQNANGTLFGWKKRKWDNSTNEMHKSDYQEWQTSNSDSSYYKSDTIKMYNYKYAYFDIKGGKTKEWFFYKKNKIGLSEGHYNQEPPMSVASACCSTIKIKKHKGSLIILIKKDKVIIDKFKVESLKINHFRNDDKKPYYVMTLIRLETEVF